MTETTNKNLRLLIEASWLTPTKKRVLIGVLFSLVIHVVGIIGFRYSSLFRMAYDLRGIEFIDREYDRVILIKLSTPLKYPGGYIGFTTPDKTLDLEKLKVEEMRRQKALEVAKKRAESIAEKKEIAHKRTKEVTNQQVVAQKTEPEVKPTPKPTPTGFKPINTRPIREQIQQLYDLKQEGKLVFNENNLRVGVSGEVKADGSIVNSRVFIASGNPQIDRAAISVLDAVSESRALGPLSQLTSLSMILTVDGQQAQLVTTGFAPNMEAAINLQNIAQVALALGRRVKASDPASMILLNNIKVTQSGNRIQATIAVSRQAATDTLAKTMAKSAGNNQ